MRLVTWAADGWVSVMAMGCWEAGLEFLEPIAEERLLFVLRMLMTCLLMSRVQVVCELCVKLVQQLLERGSFNGRVVEQR